MLKRILSIFLISFLGLSCNWFQAEEDTANVIAKAGAYYLKVSDVPKHLYENRSKQDSASAVENYINNWAATHLLLGKALINLPDEKQKAFDKLVTSYKADLYTRAYKQALMKKEIDTLISTAAMQSFYDENKENFRLNEDLVKLRFATLPIENNSIEEITSRIRRYNASDAQYLDSINVQFIQYSLDTDRWLSSKHVLQKIPVLNTKVNQRVLKKSQFISLKDSVGVYLIQIEAVLERNQIAPLSYVSSTIRQILLNKRKLEYIKQLEQEVLTEAVEKNEFKIYE